MTERLLILGSGKMAQNIGEYFLQRGCHVWWMSTDDERLSKLKKRISKIQKRMARLSDGSQPLPAVRFLRYGDPLTQPPDIVLESVAESLPVKQGAIDSVMSRLDRQTLLFSNSSSILPDDLYPDLAALHFFYPVQLTTLVEVIIPDGYPSDKHTRLLDFLSRYELKPVMQKEENAFTANRLLLPIQAEVCRLLLLGIPATRVESASRHPLIPAGQLSMMDAIGLDVLLPAVGNYLERMPETERKDYEPLLKLLSELVRRGKGGTKNRDGLLCGEPLPWLEMDVESEPPHWAEDLRDLVVQSCRRVLQRKWIDENGLELVLDSVYQAEQEFLSLLSQEQASGLDRRLQLAFERSGLSYFKAME